MNKRAAAGVLCLTVFPGSLWAADDLPLASAFPAENAKDVCPDVPLALTFDAPPQLHDGTITVVDEATSAVVETINTGKPTDIRSIGGLANFNYYPVIITGNTAQIFPRQPLAYGKTYDVTISAGTFGDKGTPAKTYGGTGDPHAWRFTTKAKPPAVDAGRLVIAADGTGDFATVQAALDFVPVNNNKPITLFLKKGTYREMVYVTNKHNLTFAGEDRKQTVIAYANNNNFNNVPGVYHRGLFTAQRCNDLVFSNLTLHNTTPQGGSQAEAIILNGTPTSRAILTDVDLFSFQDTLQINGQAYVRNCYIEGDVDFMWGSGPCFFEKCEAKALRDKAYYTQIRNPATNHGYVFYQCTFTGGPNITGNLLSRIEPVRFPASEVVLIDCVMDNAVGSIAWQLDRVSNPATAPTEKLRFWEFNSHDAAGKPVDVSKRLAASKQLKQPEDAETIAHYSDAAWVLGGWNPKDAAIFKAAAKP